MTASRAVRRGTALVLTACALVTVAPLSSSPVHAGTDRLRVTFDADGPVGGVLGAGALVADVSGLGNTGTVVTAYGGSVGAVTANGGVAADFPGKCQREPCPNALVEVHDDASLDPLLADFEWGARIKLKSTETANGENVLQKGRYGELGGQWKLQVDHSSGLPSCVVSGKVPGSTTERQVVLVASVGIANGAWHQVTCRRTSTGVKIFIDGVQRGSAAMPVVMLDSAANVTIGAKDVQGIDNDQFLGVLDDVFMTVLNDEPVPNTAPTAAFTSACVDVVCTFDASTSVDDGALNYAWDFGDGGTATGVAPSHSFVGTGDHAVTLTVTDEPGLSASVRQTVTVGGSTPPTAAFTAGCVDLGCSFDASGSAGSGPLTYAWDFGDGGSGTGVAATHAFTATGDHVVTLTVTDGLGVATSNAQTVTIPPNVAPVAAFNSSCTNLACTFDASTSTDTGPVGYAWTFGDGGTAIGVAPAHTYAAAGTFSVVLTVTDAFGASASAVHDVTVTRPVTPITFVGQASASGQLLNHVATVPSTVRAGDAMLMFFSIADAATVTQPSGVTGWVPVDTLTASNGSTRVWRKVATATDAGKQVKIGVSALSKGNITIVAYRGTSTTNPVAGFARLLSTTSSALRTTPTTNVGTPAVVVSYWMHRDSSTTALTPPAGVTVRATGTQSGGGRVTVLTVDSGTAAPTGPYGGLTAKAATAGPLGTTWTIVLAPA